MQMMIWMPCCSPWWLAFPCCEVATRERWMAEGGSRDLVRLHGWVWVYCYSLQSILSVLMIIVQHG